MNLVEATGWGWRYAGRTTWAIHDLDLRIAPGERVLLLGASGAGKSTLLLALAGVLGGADEGTEAGQLLVDGQHPTRRVGQAGLVQQDPAAQIILARVGDDVAFGCENLGVPPGAIWPRVHRSLAAVGLAVPLDRSTAALSGGQQQRLAIAGSLAMQDPDDKQKRPRLLLLDEPTANLDPAGIGEVRRGVARVLEDRSTALIVVEHRVGVWSDLIDRVVVLGPAGVVADGSPASVFAARGADLARAGVWVPGIALPVRPRPALAQDQLELAQPILQGLDLTIGYRPDQPVRSALNVAIPAGASTVITGPNGTGKSALALTLAGLLPQLGGTVAAADTLVPAPANRRQRRLAAGGLADPHRWTSAQLLTRLGTVFQEAAHQFVAGSVREELAVGLKALRWSPASIATRVDELLGLLHLDALADANPFTLSGGEKRRLSVGTVLASGPAVIVLDEPTFGQDRTTWLDLVGLINRVLDEGRTVISVTHDHDFLALLSQHRIDLGGQP